MSEHVKSRQAAREIAQLGRVGTIGWPSVSISAVVFTLVPFLWWATATGLIPRYAATPCMILLQFAAFTPMHESTHSNIGGSRAFRALDIICGWGCAAILLVPMPLFRSGHLQHHAAVNQPGRDPDLWVARARPLTRLLGCFTFVPRYYWNFARGAVPPRTEPHERRIIGLGFCAMGAFVAAMTYAGYGWMLAWLWIGPGIITGGLLALCFAWLPHAPHGDPGRFTNARVFDTPLLTIPLMCHNYHLIHHLWPRIPFHRYASVFRMQREELTKQGAKIV